MDLVSVSHSYSFMATTQRCLSYDVFLSFGGEDTREGFTDHLSASLNQADGFESRFISDIVNIIRKKLDYKALYIEEKLVGIGHHNGILEFQEISYKTLHIACFFEGEKKNYIVKLLAECDLYPMVGIKNLIDRCLLYVDEEGRVKMHQLVKEMGREVVRKDGKRSRLWHHHDCIDVLKDQSGTAKVGLMLGTREMKEAKSTCNSKNYYGKRMYGNNGNFEIGAREKMKNLMLLPLNYVTLSRKCRKLSRKF